MQRNDTDLVLRMITNNYVMFRETNEDPIFAAHKSFPIITNFGQEGDRYYADFPVGVIACAQQVSAFGMRFTVNLQSDLIGSINFAWRKKRAIRTAQP